MNTPVLPWSRLVAPLVTVALLLACSPDPVPARPMDAAADRLDGTADATADGAPEAAADATMEATADAAEGGACGAAGPCTGGQRCDPARLRCVDCLATDHCGGATPVCASGRCVAATPCNSSRMCPGQVCDLNQMRCVDCVTDAECDMGQRCVASVCAAPVTCRSSRDCSAGGLVCNVAQMRCVECLEDRDCAMGSACTSGNVCRVSACTAGARRCVSATRLATCDMRGAAETEADCASGEVCTGGECRRLLCVPGAASCESAMARRACNADGMAYTVTACASGETCTAGECRAPGCTPGAATCTSTTERRVCNADGMTFATMACAAGQTCSGGACAVAPGCPAGQTRCGAACVALQTDATNCGMCGRSCPAGQACAAGTCTAVSDDIPPLNVARWGFGTVVLPDGRIVVLGGFGTPDYMNPLNTLEVYDPATGRWATRSMPVSLGNVRAVGLPDGRIFIANGTNMGGGTVFAQGRFYDPAADVWSLSRTTLRFANVNMCLADDRTVYVFGGMEPGSPDHLGYIHRYDPADDSMTRQSTMTSPLRETQPIQVGDGRILLLGGSNSNVIDAFSPSTRAVTRLPVRFLSARAAGAVTLGADGKAYYAGGSALVSGTTTAPLAEVYALDPTTNTLTNLAPLPEPRVWFALVARTGGRLTAIGGYTRTGTTGRVLASTVTYTIATNTWR